MGVFQPRLGDAGPFVAAEHGDRPLVEGGTFGGARRADQQPQRAQASVAAVEAVAPAGNELQAVIAGEQAQVVGHHGAGGGEQIIGQLVESPVDDLGEGQPLLAGGPPGVRRHHQLP